MLAAILFDLDGTLANTDPLHFQTWQEVLRAYDMDIDRAFYDANISGRLNPVIVRDLLPQLSPVEGEQLAFRKEAQFREIALGLTPLAGLLDVLQWIRDRELKTAVVTNAPRENVNFVLEVLGLINTFDTVVLSEEVATGKPDPAPYQFALKQLGISAQEAIAFEDSPSGIKSAVAAGIHTIGIASTHNPNHLADAGAAMVIPDFTAKELWQLLDSWMGVELTVSSEQRTVT